MKSKALIRFFGTYLLFFLCVSLMLVPTYIRYYKILQERERSITSTMIENGADAVNNQILSLISLSQTTYADSRYGLLFNSNATVPVKYFTDLNQVQKDFTSLIGIQPLVSDAGIVFRNGMTLTRYRSFFNTDYYSTFFTYEDMGYKEWYQTLRSNFGDGFLPSAKVNSSDYGSYDCITFVCPWPSNFTVNPSGVFYATLKIEDIISQLVPEEIARDGYVLVYDSMENLLINHQYTTNEGFSTISYQGSLSGLRVEIGIPDFLIAQHLAPVRNLFVIYASVMILISILLASVFAYRSTNPIRKLVEIITHTPSVHEQLAAGANEYDFIANAVTGLDNTINTYQKTIDTQKNIIRIHMFEKALSEGLHSKLASGEFIKSFPDFPDCYQLASLSFTIQGDNLFEKSVALQVALLEKISSHLPDSIYTQTYGDSTIILVLPVPAPYDAEADIWVKSLEQLHSYLIDRYDLDFHIALSECFSDCKNLSEAYSQIRNITLLSNYRNTRAVWQLKNFPRRTAHMALDFTVMQQLYDALLLGDMETAESILSSSYQSIQTNGYVDETAIRQIYYSFRNVLLRVKLESHDTMASLSVPPYNQEANVTHHFNELSRCCREICSIMRTLRESSKEQFSNSVCDFIIENISNEALYAKMVASHFNISETTLQKLIRAATGKTFFEYVEDLRLEKAYHLLKNSDMTVNNIAAACGFSSSNSFYKAFKRRYNQPPSTVRDISK